MGKNEQSQRDMKKFTGEFLSKYKTVSSSPIAEEQREAKRLVELLQKRYRKPGCAAEYIGPEKSHDLGTRTLFGLGCFRIGKDDALPEDLYAVQQLCVCINAINVGSEEYDRIFNAKRLIALLMHAQEMCKERPVPIKVHLLCKFDRQVLSILNELSAENTLDRFKRMEILDRYDQIYCSDNDEYGSGDSIKASCKKLVTLGLLVAFGNRAATTYRITVEGSHISSYITEHSGTDFNNS